MQETVKQIQTKVATLNNWIAEMNAIIENPYSAGLNVERMLNDLKGFANDLAKQVDTLVEEPEEDKKAEKASK